MTEAEFDKLEDDYTISVGVDYDPDADNRTKRIQNLVNILFFRDDIPLTRVKDLQNLLWIADGLEGLRRMRNHPMYVLWCIHDPSLEEAVLATEETERKLATALPWSVRTQK